MDLRLNFREAGLRVCIDGTEHGGFQGRVLGRRLSEPLHFSDISEMVLKLDALMDVQKFPQAFQRIRSFTEKEQPAVPAVRSKAELSSAEEVEAARGEVATFLLQVFSRQNASWQGRIDWLDGTPAQEFHSTLECMKLMDARLRTVAG